MTHLDMPLNKILARSARDFTSRDVSNGQPFIPTSVVVGVAFGIAAFILIILTILFTVRFIRLKQCVRIAHEAGQTEVTFRTAWQDQGGLVGFLSGQGYGSGSFGTDEADLWRMERMLAEYEKRRQEPSERPSLHDVEVLPGRQAGITSFDLGSLTPLSVQSSPHPPFTHRLRMAEQQMIPEFYLNVLVAMPSKPEPRKGDTRPRNNESSEGDGEVPQIVIGSTVIEPMLYVKTPESKLAHQYFHRRPRWQVAKGGKWTYEGLD